MRTCCTCPDQAGLHTGLGTGLAPHLRLSPSRRADPSSQLNMPYYQLTGVDPNR